MMMDRWQYENYMKSVERKMKKQTNNQKVTNADKIRSMTDEELAKYFSDLIKDAQEYEYSEDASNWLKWLQQKRVDNYEVDING